MSDEEQPKPPPDYTQLRERLARMREEALAKQAAREQAERDMFLAAIAETARKTVEVFRQLPCGGEIAGIARCSEVFAEECAQAQSPSCPRVIVAYDKLREQESLNERLSYSGIPRGLLGVLSEAFLPTEATQAVDEWLVTSLRLLLLSGGVGTGKSVAAAYAIKRSPGRWMHASDIANAGRSENQERMRELLSCRLLVIDDLGSEYNDASGWGRSQLITLLLKRYEEGARTIITTNLDGKGWQAYADQRIKDRIIGGGAVRIIGGKSRRGT